MIKQTKTLQKLPLLPFFFYGIQYTQTLYISTCMVYLYIHIVSAERDETVAMATVPALSPCSMGKLIQGLLKVQW